MKVEEDKQKSRVIAVRVPIDLYEEIDAYRENNGFNWSWYIKQCLTQKMKEINEAKQSNKSVKK